MTNEDQLKKSPELMQRVRRVIIGEEIFLKPKKVLIKNTVSITFTILQIASQIGFLGCYKDKNTKLHNFFLQYQP